MIISNLPTEVCISKMKWGLPDIKNETDIRKN